MQRMYGERPDIRAWRAEISKDYNVKDILFFGDFSNQSLRSDIPRIREVSSSIIETQNASAFHKKDHTDFIMLDHIYQRVMTYGDDTDVFIIFSGDGHFSSVASFLVKTAVRKKVVVYGVRDCLSTQLANTASVAFEMACGKAALFESAGGENGCRAQNGKSGECTAYRTIGDAVEYRAEKGCGCSFCKRAPSDRKEAYRRKSGSICR